MTKVYLIDDSVNRHWQYSKLLHESQEEYECSTLGTPGSYENVSDPQHIANAMLSIDCDSIWQMLSESDLDSVFLVDFNLGKVDAQNTADAQKLETYLSEHSEAAVKDKTDQLLATVSEAFKRKYFHAVFSCAFLKARGVPAIVISTHQDGYENGELEKLITKLDLGHAASLSTQEAWMKWKEQINTLLRHPDSAIRQILASYNKPIVNDTQAWQHDWCQSMSGIDYGHEVLSIAAFDGDNLKGSEIAENKAFHMRTNNEWCVIPAAAYPVCKSSVEKALQVIGIDAVVNCEAYRFPVSPGIAFLISFKELLLACLDKDGKDGNGAPVSVECFTGGDNRTDPEISGVRIQLEDRAGHGLHVVKRLIEKVRGSKSEEKVPQGGLCRAVWNLGHCRSSGIQANNEPWAEMFANGSPHWVAWPSFSKDTITFHW